MTISNPLPEIAPTPSAPAASVVSFTHVSIGFDGKQVLNDINFTVQPGETRIILGPASCGKSVLLKLANGLMLPDSGQIQVFGQEVTTLRQSYLFQLRVKIGMVFQESALFDSMTVRENVAYQLRETNVEDTTVEARVLEVLRFVELEHTLDKFPSQLSGGMRRRVAIARAIITHPELLLYDSPTGGLDPITSATIMELIIKLRDVYQSTALLVTHRLQDAYMLATHIFNPSTNQMERIPNNGLHQKTKFLVLNNTRVLFDGPLQELRRSEDPFLKEFLS